MATYAVGDVQGCFDELQSLLARIRFDPAHDRLWLVGDLVNRGPQSLEVLRYVRGLGARALTVLGNHDLHLVCVHEGLAGARPDDTLEAVLAAPDGSELVDWLRCRPLFHVEGSYAMVHAGLLPAWSLDKARSLAAEVESALRGGRYRDFLAQLYGSRPDRWDDGLLGWDRLRVVVNAMTRMRFCTAEGVMEFREKGASPPPGYQAWFDARPRQEAQTLICGHWSALGLRVDARTAALDSGCVWGRQLSALRLDDRAVFQVDCLRRPASG